MAAPRPVQPRSSLRWRASRAAARPVPSARECARPRSAAPAGRLAPAERTPRTCSHPGEQRQVQHQQHQEQRSAISDQDARDRLGGRGLRQTPAATAHAHQLLFEHDAGDFALQPEPRSQSPTRRPPAQLRGAPVRASARTRRSTSPASAVGDTRGDRVVRVIGIATGFPVLRGSLAVPRPDCRHQRGAGAIAPPRNRPAASTESTVSRSPHTTTGLSGNDCRPHHRVHVGPSWLGCDSHDQTTRRCRTSLQVSKRTRPTPAWATAAPRPASRLPSDAAGQPCSRGRSDGRFASAASGGRQFVREAASSTRMRAPADSAHRIRSVPTSAPGAGVGAAARMRQTGATTFATGDACNPVSVDSNRRLRHRFRPGAGEVGRPAITTRPPAYAERPSKRAERSEPSRSNWSIASSTARPAAQPVLRSDASRPR